MGKWGGEIGKIEGVPSLGSYAPLPLSEDTSELCSEKFPKAVFL